MLLKEGMSAKKAQSLSAKLVNEYDGLKENEIKDWREAHEYALDAEKPNRYDLYTIYRDVLLDSHLNAVIKVRLEKVLKSEFQLVDKKTGEINPEATDMLKKRWFWQFMTYAWRQNMFGFSLIEFGDLIQTEDGYEFKEVKEIDRRFLHPEKGTYVLEPYSEDEFSYKKGGVANWLIELGNKKDLGFLLEAAPLAISNKYMGIFWDNFAEMFGAPIRIAKTNANNTDERTRAAEMLEQMGFAGWGVFDNGTDIEIKESAQKDSFNVYDKRMERNEKGMSKLVLGNTMTVDDGSSHSQSKVHAGITEDVVASDKREMIFDMNEELLPFLIKHGYPFENLRFKWDETERVSLKEQADIDKWLIDYFEIDVEYFKTKYNSSIIDFTKKEETKEELGK